MAIVLIVVIAVTVLTDLPGHATRSSQIAGDTTMMSEVNSDLGPCSFALGESFTIYGDLTGHRLTRSDAAEAPRLLTDDQDACSYTDESTYDLSSIGVPGSAAGKHLNQLVYTVSVWATSDALRAIEEIQTLLSNPSDAAALRKLAKAEHTLAEDRAQAEAELAGADKALRAHLPALQIARAPVS